jgi:hypothetical protein
LHHIVTYYYFCFALLSPVVLADRRTYLRPHSFFFFATSKDPPTTHPLNERRVLYLDHPNPHLSLTIFHLRPPSVGCDNQPCTLLLVKLPLFPHSHLSSRLPGSSLIKRSDKGRKKEMGGMHGWGGDDAAFWGLDFSKLLRLMMMLESALLTYLVV